MKRFSPLWTAATAVALMCALPDNVRANGENFFAPVPSDGPVHLAYVGRIKDAVTGRQIKKELLMTITDSKTSAFFPIMDDQPGHYRTPDIGRMLKGMGEDVDPKRLSAEIIVDGYKPKVLEVFPRRAHGVVELNIALEPLGEPEAAAGSGNDGGLGLSSTVARTLGGLVALLIVGIGVRTLILPQSTAH